MSDGFAFADEVSGLGVELRSRITRVLEGVRRLDAGNEVSDKVLDVRLVAVDTVARELPSTLLFTRKAWLDP